MIACLQRVSQAEVRVESETVGTIDRGLLVLLGVAEDDTVDDADLLADKIINLRIFEDDQGKMNLAVGEVGGGILAVSQFTLLADCRKGRRPSFTSTAPPERAEELYQRFVRRVQQQGVPVATGRFRQHMHVELINDGPVTILLDSRRLAGPRRA